jgi:polysaccharide export outer membrane protein
MKKMGEEGGRITGKSSTTETLLAVGCVLVLGLFSGCKHATPETTYPSFKMGTNAPSYVRLTNMPSYSTVPSGTRTAAPGRMQAITLPRKIEPAWLRPPADLFTLGPGDRLEIEIIGDPTSRTATIVGPDGKIYFSLLPGIDVWGATLSQAKALLENELAKYVREKPQVGIVLRGIESKRVWVLGRVQAPGVYAMATPLTLLEALSMAGGTMSLANYQDQEAAGISEELADLNHSFVIRQGKLLPVDFSRLLRNADMTQNIYLQPDDFVYLPAARAKEIYVIGAVAQPRAVVWSEGMTVVGAVASAYGTIKGAYMHHVAVVRGSLTQPEIAVVDYRGVLRGEALDIALQPHDIVYVPFSPYRYIDKYLELVLDTFVSAAAINAGTRLTAREQISGAGVFIPVGSGVNIIPPVNPPPVR